MPPKPGLASSPAPGSAAVRIVATADQGRIFKIMRWLMGLIGAGVFSLTVTLYWSYLGTFNLEVTHTEIELPDLPAEFDGYRIALISCLHTDRFAARERLLRSKLREIRTDLLVVAGDFGKKGRRPQDTLESCRRIFEGLQFPDGIVATKGNQDRSSMLGPLGRMGLVVLFNDCLTVHRRSGPRNGDEASGGNEHAAGQPDDSGPDAAALTFVGVGHARRRDPDWPTALARAEPGSFRIGICHSPDGVVSAAGHSLPLLLCGHTHGGQIRLPGLGPLVTETRLVGRRFAAGLCRYRDTLVYVNRGIGWTGVPLRFRCRPEISVLILRRPR